MQRLVILILVPFLLVMNCIFNGALADIQPPVNFNLLGTTKSLSQHGITWTFSEAVTYGQFVNGDYWVVDPGSGVRITNISPGYSTSPRGRNGSMINPSSLPQGYDSVRDYSSAVNVGIGISGSTPLVLTTGDSLVSTISVDTVADANASYVKTAAVLTCLASPPPANSFRPGISGTTKTLHNLSSVNLSLLKDLAVPAALTSTVTAASFPVYANYFKMVWLDHTDVYTARNMHTVDCGLSNYYFSVEFAEAALMLHLNFSNSIKNELLINYLQMGIDLYSYLESGGIGWLPNGGHSSGRKWPILFAGLMLGYAPMRNIGQVSGDHLYSSGYGPGNAPPTYKHFGEDAQTFYVKQFDVNITHGPTWTPDDRTAPNYPYTTEMIGMPEWGIRYSTNPNYSDAAWPANYRSIGSGVPSWAGFTMAARIMDAKPLWNNDALFDYVDRYMAIANGNPDPFGYTVPNEGAGSRWNSLAPLAINIYDSYRKNY